MIGLELLIWIFFYDEARIGVVHLRIKLLYLKYNYINVNSYENVDNYVNLIEMETRYSNYSSRWFLANAKVMIVDDGLGG